MTKPAHCANTSAPTAMRLASLKTQQGDALMEALIGIVLIAVIGLGLSYAAGRALNAQRNAATHGIALAQMRHALESQGIQKLCAGTATARIQFAPTGGSAVNMSLPTPTNCTPQSIAVSVRDDTSFPSTNISIITRMQLSSPDTDEARALLGTGVLTLGQ